MHDNDERASVQLFLIGEVSQILGKNGIEHWLFGGWGVDFLVGVITRVHDEIEFLIWRRDAERASGLLAQNGFSPLYRREDGMGWLISADKIEFDFLTCRRDGLIVTTGWDEWPWTVDAFGGAIGRLRDITGRVVSAEAQLETKELYQRFRPRIGLRGRDRSDIAYLRDVVARRCRRP